MSRSACLSASCCISLILFLQGASFGAAATYYLSPDGSDRADGKAPDRAWKTINRLSSVPLGAGDQVLFHRGGVWHETFTLPAGGAQGQPILLGAYGQGELPRIDGGDQIEPSQFQPTDAPMVYRAPFDRQLQIVWQGTGAPLIQASSPSDVELKKGSCWCGGGSAYIHPIDNTDPRQGNARYEIPGREVCIEISHGHIAIRSIAICHAARADRGAVTVWADHDLSDIEMTDCDIADNCGRGVWLDGPAASSIRDVLIQKNQFRANDGSGVLLIKANGARLIGNQFSQNCRRAIEPWQAAIRLWSSGVRNVEVRNNTIADERWMHDRDSAMGIHCDETGDHVVIADNSIRNVDHEGIAVENTRGVIVEKNTIADCNIGIFINRAGHDHTIRDNTISDSRSQGLAIQGWLAHGVDAGPEIIVEGRLFSRNLILGNLITGSRFGNLKATGGGERVDPPLGAVFRGNDFGPQRPGFIEWGDRTLDRYDQWPVPGGASRQH